MPARHGVLIAVLSASLVTVGCGKEEEDPKLPAVCSAGPGQVRAALMGAPGRVTIEGTPISNCFIRAADAADVQLVGSTLLAVAAPLAERAQRDPDGDAALQLGYLIGAIQRGTKSKQGIYAESVRRLNQELANVDRRTSSFRRGEKAGNTSG